MPFLSFDVEIRKVICSTNAIESVNARIRKAVRARGHFPNEAAAMKCVYMALMSLDPDRQGPQAVDHALESTPERLPDRLRRPAHPGRQLTPTKTGSAVYWTHPRLAVRAAGVNPFDWKVLQGWVREMFPLDFPAGLGSDVAGVVEAVGEGVTGFAVGDEVLGASLTPSYAQFALADPSALIAKPASVSWEVAGSLAAAGGTALTALDRLKVTEGETVLIHAAAGGVGTFAVQLAVARGAKVIGTASERNHDLLRSLGAVPVTYGEGLLDRVRAIAPDGVDAVFDASGHGEIPDSIELAGGPERVLTIVAFDAADTGIQLHEGRVGAEVYREIVRHIEEGHVRVSIARTYPLAQAAAALDESRTGHVNGKLVILP